MSGIRESILEPEYEDALDSYDGNQWLASKSCQGKMSKKQWREIEERLVVLFLGGLAHKVSFVAFT